MAGTERRRSVARLTVAAVTLANGGDSIGGYVPMFATSRTGGLLTYVAVFLVLTAVWCAAGYLVASRPMVGRAPSRWGHILRSAVPIGIGLTILIHGDAFGCSQRPRSARLAAARRQALRPPAGRCTVTWCPSRWSRGSGGDRLP